MRRAAPPSHTCSLFTFLQSRPAQPPLPETGFLPSRKCRPAQLSKQFLHVPASSWLHFFRNFEEPVLYDPGFSAVRMEESWDTNSIFQVEDKMNFFPSTSDDIRAVPVP